MKKKAKKGTVPDVNKKKYQTLFGNQFARKYDKEFIERLADEMLKWFTEKNAAGQQQIWLGDFAIEKMISRQRFPEFAKENEYFKNIYTICKEIEESRMIKIGFTSKSGMPFFILKNLHNYTDAQKVVHSGAIEEKITFVEKLDE